MSKERLLFLTILKKVRKITKLHNIKLLSNNNTSIVVNFDELKNFILKSSGRKQFRFGSILFENKTCGGVFDFLFLQQDAEKFL